MAWTSAEMCRQRGWKRGTVLVADDPYLGPTQIVITAVGERLVLARRISQNGEATVDHEREWPLPLRDWRHDGFIIPSPVHTPRSKTGGEDHG